MFDLLQVLRDPATSTITSIVIGMAGIAISTRQSTQPKTQPHFSSFKKNSIELDFSPFET